LSRKSLNTSTECAMTTHKPSREDQVELIQDLLIELEPETLLLSKTFSTYSEKIKRILQLLKPC